MPLFEGLIILVAFYAVVTLVPTVGMYRQTNDEQNWEAWTGGMFVLSLLLPVVGSVVLWAVYTFAN